jgi:hypothetical protein
MVVEFTTTYMQSVPITTVPDLPYFLGQNSPYKVAFPNVKLNY